MSSDHPTVGNFLNGNHNFTGRINFAQDPTINSLPIMFSHPGLHYGEIPFWNSNTNSFDVTNNSLHIGNDAGLTGQSGFGIAIGISAGQSSQQGIGIGFQAAQYNQSYATVAIGFNAGQTGQSAQSVCIGQLSGNINQGSNSVAVGAGSGQDHQSGNSVAIGFSSGCFTQGSFSTSVGNEAGHDHQGTHCVAIGHDAGQLTQGDYSVAIGSDSGQTAQGTNCIAIGKTAGATAQGNNAIAIGQNAGVNSQSANSICLNATGTLLDTANSGLFVAPVTALSPSSDFTGLNLLTYNISTKEVKYQNINSSKTFVIDHPLDKEKYLVHACIEGPESSVFYRGEGKINNNVSTLITLPEYTRAWSNFTVYVTQVNMIVDILDETFKPQSVNFTVSNVINGSFRVYGENGKFSYLALAKREDIEVEPNKSDVIVHGDGPYRYI